MSSTKSTPEGVTLRLATRDDMAAVLRLMDMAIVWLVSQGRPGQWGTEPRSKNPDTIKTANEIFDSGGCWVAVDEKAAAAADAELAAHKASGATTEPPLTILNGVVGAMAVGESKHYVPKPTEPETYVTLMLVDRAQSGRGIGKMLMDKVMELALEAKSNLIRVDCYNGDDGKLVKQYERMGFKQLNSFEVTHPDPKMARKWPGMLLTMRLDGA